MDFYYFDGLKPERPIFRQSDVARHEARYHRNDHRKETPMRKLIAFVDSLPTGWQIAVCFWWLPVIICLMFVIATN